MKQKNLSTTQILNFFLKNILVELPKKQQNKIKEVITSIMETRSFRISKIGESISKKRKIKKWGGYEFVKRVFEKIPIESVKRFMLRMFDERSEWVLADTTEIEMKWVGKNHPYAGYLKDGKTKGILVFAFGVPYNGRTKIFLMLPFSTKVLENLGKGKFEWYVEVIEGLRRILGERLVVFDREFSNAFVFESLMRMGVRFLIRIKIGGNVRIVNERGEDVKEIIRNMKIGERRIIRDVWYGGRVKLNLVVHKGYGEEPLVLATNKEPSENMVEIYLSRMKIEQSFRDVKSLGIESMMVRDFEKVTKMLLLANIALNVSTIAGEKIREHLSESMKEKYSGVTIFFYLLKKVVRDCIPSNRLSLLYQQIESELLSILLSPKIDQTPT